MLRRSFSVLLAFLLFGLLMILGYAFFNRAGVETSIEEARVLLGEDNPSAAVRILNRTQRSMGPGTNELTRRDLHLLRAAAMADNKLRNYEKAVEELDFLISEFKDEHFDASDPRGFPFAVDKLGILRRRVQYLLLAGDVKTALGAARTFLEEHADDQVVLDLAGQAMQTLYQKNYKSILEEDLDLVLSAQQRRKLVQELDPWLFKSPNAPAAGRHFAAMHALLDVALDPLAVTEVLEKCRQLRGDIQTCANYYSKALDGPLAMPASLQGYTGIQLRTGDLDAAAALSFLYLQRFDTFVASIAARRCMEAHLLQNDPVLAMQVGKAWIEEHRPNRIEDPILQDWNLGRAYAWYGLALYQEGKTDELADLARSLGLLHKISGNEVTSIFHWTQGLAFFLKGNPRGCEEHLTWFCKDPGIYFEPPFGLDLFVEAMRTRIAAAKKAGNAPLAQEVLKEWIGRRPERVEPRLLLAHLMVEKLGLHRLASRECEVILAMPRDGDSHDQALNLLLLAQNLRLSQQGMDWQSLARDLIEKKVRIHLDLPHPVLRYGIAYYAFDVRADQVFEANIRRFLEDYPESTHGRYLLAEYYFREGTYDRALYETNSILAVDPNHLPAAVRHRKTLMAMNAPRATLVAFDKEFMDRFSEQAEAAEILGEMLLARGADEAAMLVSTQSEGAQVDPAGMSWIKGRAQLALDQPEEAVKTLRKVPPESDHREQALLLALQTSLDDHKWDKATAIVSDLLESKAPPRTLSLAAQLCGKHRMESAVLDLLDPIFLGRDEESRDVRNGEFFTLRGRAFMARGRSKDAKDMFMRAVSFDDGGQAGAYLTLLELLSGRKDQAHELLEQLGELEGSPLILLLLDAKLGDFESARKRLEQASLPSASLAKVLRLALDSKAGKQEHDLKTSTGIARLDSFARGHAERVLEALCFAGDMAFRARSDEAQVSLEAWVSEGEEALVERFLVDLIGAWRAELRGPALAGMLSFGTLLRPSSQDLQLMPFFVLAHREYLRLADNDYDLLTNTELTGYFLNVMKDIGLGPSIQLGIAPLALLGTGRQLRKQGNFELARRLFANASLLIPKDLAILEWVADVDEEAGRPDRAIMIRLKRHALLDGLDKVRELQKMLLLRDRIDKAGRLAEPSYAESLASLQELIFDYLEAKTTPLRPPLGRAALIETRKNWDKDPETVELLLTRCFTPYLEGGFAPGLDPEGLTALLEYLLSKNHPQAMTWLQGLLLQDPSLIGLRRLEACELSRRGQRKEALEAIARMENLLPSEETRLTLARLRARTGIGTRAQKRALLRRLHTEHDAVSRLEQALLRFRLGDLAGCMKLADSLDPEDIDAVDQRLLDLARLYARSYDDYAAIQMRMQAAGQEGSKLARDLATQIEYLIPQDAKAGR